MEGRELELGTLLTLLGHAESTMPRQLNELAYMAQELGVPMGLQFRMHHHGPYSERLDRDISWLERRGFIEQAESGDGLHLIIRLAWPETLEQRQADLEWRAHTEPHRELLRELGQAYLGCTTAEIHADAALCFVDRNPRGEDPESRRNGMIAALQHVMPGMGREEMEARHDRLARLGWVTGSMPAPVPAPAYDPLEPLLPSMNAATLLNEVLWDIMEDHDGEYPDDEEADRLAPHLRETIMRVIRENPGEPCSHSQSHLSDLAHLAAREIPREEILALRAAMTSEPGNAG